MDKFFEDNEEDEIFKNLDLTSLSEVSDKCITPSENDTLRRIDCLVVPEIFDFPFTPYPQQLDLMQTLYRTIEQGKVGIFESPTGTGKSMSLLCASLRWILDNELRERRDLETLRKETDCEDSSNDWIAAYQKKTVRSRTNQPKIDALARKMESLKQLQELRKSRNRLNNGKLKAEFARMFGEKAVEEVKAEVASALNDDDIDDPDGDIILEDYDSDSEAPTDKGSNEEDLGVTKIFVCSRTHSQLTQLVGELIKSPYATNVAAVSLGSRKNLCINEAVRQLKSISLMNDKCLEMQQSKKKTSGPPPVKQPRCRRSQGSAGPCQYRSATATRELSAAALTEPLDLEDLVSSGRRLRACPYYSARSAVPLAQLVILPYQTLLHRPTREASGVNIAGNVVIIDEAHNLAETVASVHSAHLTAMQVACARRHLSMYMERYKSRLSAKNLLYVRQILTVVTSFDKFMSSKTTAVGVKLLSVNDFLFETNIDNINLFKLLQYLKVSHLSQKLCGFARKDGGSLTADNKLSASQNEGTLSGLKSMLKSMESEKQQSVPVSDENTENKATYLSPMLLVEGFLSTLTSSYEDGRISIGRNKKEDPLSMKFLVLNPGKYLEDVIREARSVILAGGTMQPVTEFRDQLLAAAGCPLDRIVEFSCGHVVQGEQLLAVALAEGPGGQTFDFTYQSRGRPEMMKECGRFLVNIASVVPGGMVIFFPSYDYESQVHGVWEQAGILRSLESKKKVFREPRLASSLESVMRSYSRCILEGDGKGAVLLCVIGGKMSEGINFSDDLGRCVVVVGMPYPNPGCPELKEKMNFLNRQFRGAKKKEGPSQQPCRTPGQEHYENLCMKAVNQSIGRAIRHKNDYAAVFLLDQRYHRSSVTTLLPGWIREVVTCETKFGSALKRTKDFFVKMSKSKEL